MTIQECNFTFGDESNTKYEVQLCDFETVSTESNDEESTEQYSTTPNKRTWDYHGSIKSSPLSFKIKVFNIDGSYIDAEKERELKKWLCKPTRQWLSIKQDDLYDIMYYCKISNPQKVNIARRSGGIQFTVTCDAGHAWSNIKSQKYTSTTTLTFKIPINLDYSDEIVRPIITINSKANQTISIKNNTTNRTLTISGCSNGEKITLDGENEMIESSTNRVLVDNWNYQFLSLIDGTNSITLTGNFELTIQYRLPIRVGG